MGKIGTIAGVVVAGAIIAGGVAMAVPQSRDWILDEAAKVSNIHKTVVEENDNVKTEYEDLKSQIETLKAENEELQSFREYCEIEMQTLTANLDELEIQKSDLLDALTEINNLIDTTSDEITLENLEDKKLSILHNINYLNDEITLLNTEKESLNAEIENLNEYAEHLNARIVELENQQNEFTVQLVTNSRLAQMHLLKDAIDFENYTDEQLLSGTFMGERQDTAYITDNNVFVDGKYVLPTDSLKTLSAQPVNVSDISIRSIMLGLLENCTIKVSGANTYIDNTDVISVLAINNAVVKIDGVETTDCGVKIVNQNDMPSALFLNFASDIKFTNFELEYVEETQTVIINITTDVEQTLNYIGNWTYTQVGEGDTGLSDGDIFNMIINEDKTIRITLYNATSGQTDELDLSQGEITELENGLKLSFQENEVHLLTLVDENTLHVSLYDDSIKFDATRITE